MSNTSNLALPFLAVGQAQKHVTVNESLRKLDAIVQLSVVSATTTAEPVSPADGEVWIVPAGKSGTNWAPFANWSLGYYRDGAWVQVAPREGWLAYVRDSDLLLHYTGSAWSLSAVGKAITVSASDTVLGRASSGAGAAEEIACTAAGRALIDDADAAAQRATLGLGTAATQNTGTGGANLALLNGANTWSGLNIFTTFQVVQGAGMFYRVTNTAGAADEKHTDLLAANASFYIRNVNDAQSATALPLELVRSGITPALAIFDSAVQPRADNTYNFGSASNRWATVYAGTGAINTSDAREKTPLRAVSPAEVRAIRRVIGQVGVFQWLSAIEDKGADPGDGGARLHVGVTAQSVRDAFLAEGLDPGCYGLFCADPLVESVEVEPVRTLGATEERSAITLPARYERRPVVDATGEPVSRLGVRHDQIFALALAALFAAPD